MCPFPDASRLDACWPGEAVDGRSRDGGAAWTIGAVDVVEALTRLGGVSDARRVVALTSRRGVSTAVAHGLVVRDLRGRYALPAADEARRAAGRLNGVVTGLSAAAAHGWDLKVPPSRPVVTVP